MKEIFNYIVEDVFFLIGILIVIFFYIFIRYYYNNLIHFLGSLFFKGKKNKNKNNSVLDRKKIYNDIYDILEHLLEDHSIKIARIFEFTNGVDFSSRFGYNKLNLTFNLVHTDKKDYNIKISDNVFCSIVWKGFLEYFFRDDIENIEILEKEKKYYLIYNGDVIERDVHDSINLNLKYPYCISAKGKDKIYVFNIDMLDRTLNLYLLGENEYGDMMVIPILIDNHFIGLIVLSLETKVIDFNIEKVLQIIDHVNMIINIYYKVYFDVMKGIKFLYLSK